MKKYFNQNEWTLTKKWESMNRGDQLKAMISLWNFN